MKGLWGAATAAGVRSADCSGTLNRPDLSRAVCGIPAGPKGPIVLSDVHLIDKLAHFDRERIPERVVHAKGAGTPCHWPRIHCRDRPLLRCPRRTLPLLPLVSLMSLTGAHGYFEVTHDVTPFTRAKFLNKVGKRTPVFTRFSTGEAPSCSLCGVLVCVVCTWV